MRLSILQPTLASTFCAGRVRARSVHERRPQIGLAPFVLNGVGAQPEIGGQRWPSRRFQASLRETGMPRAVMRLSILQPTLASTFCAGADSGRGAFCRAVVNRRTSRCR